MKELEQLTLVDLDRMCIELVDQHTCTKLKQDGRMKIQHIAEEYFISDSTIFWEDFVEILKNDFRNKRLAYLVEETYITGM